MYDKYKNVKMQQFNQLIFKLCLNTFLQQLSNNVVNSTNHVTKLPFVLTIVILKFRLRKVKYRY